MKIWSTVNVVIMIWMRVSFGVARNVDSVLLGCEGTEKAW
jgi:hypothetical protein